MGQRILDIGSGTPIKWNDPLQGRNIIHVDIDKSAFHLEVVCSIYNLPFKDNSIPIIHVSHVLEHLENPFGASKELKRVMKNFVIIKVPNASFWKVRPSGMEEHIFSWNEWTLRAFLNRIFENVEIRYTSKWSIFSRSNFSIFWKIKRIVERGFFGQNELTAVCRSKKDN